MGLNLRDFIFRYLFYASIVLVLVAMYFALSALKLNQISFTNFIAFMSLLFSILFNAPNVFLNTRSRTQEERARLHQNKLILENLKNWYSKTIFADIDYRDGEICCREHENPDLDYFEKIENILKENNIYNLWKNGIVESEKIKTRGNEAISKFHTIIEKELEIIPLKKSSGWRPLPEDSYSILCIRQTIFERIKNKNFNLHIKDKFLYDGGRLLAEGGQAILVHLKEIIENLVENEVMSENMRIFNESKEKLDYREPFKKFREKLNELIKDYTYSKIY